jgi:hypothetical protein
MDAQKTTITSIFNNATLIEVPFFQRPYVWEKDLWERFLEDMEFVVKTKKPHFLGSIILKEGRKPNAGELFADCKTVVDGQQRLTTFLIFMKALCLKTGQTLLFDCQFRIMGQEIALRHGKSDVEAFEKVVMMTVPNKITDMKSKIIDAYNFFVENADISKLDIMTIITNTQFVRIDLDADEDEQQIFDTINSLGVSLTTAELLKNYFFSRDTIAEYEDKWVSVFEKDDDTKAYWDKEVEVGRTKKAMIDIFFDAYFQLFIQNKDYNISNADKLMYARTDHLAQSYQHFINTYCGGDKNVILSSLKEYAECFSKNINPDWCDESVPSTYGIERLNVVIFGLKNSTMIPYVLYIVKNISNQNEFDKICGILESYTMRRIIVRATTKNYNNLYTSLIANKIIDSQDLVNRLTAGNDNTTFYPTDDEMKEGFHNSKIYNLQAKGILYLIESRLRPTTSATTLLGFNNYSLEHMMPKKWRNSWGLCATKELERVRDSKLLTLGNLAIIPQTLNASVRDADWNTKRMGKKDKPGLKLCAGGLVTMHDALEKGCWDETEIEKRASWLCEKAVNMWSI